MVPGRFKDYISTPKQNDYRSIHTTIVGPSRQRIELQIRTREMNKIAEYGVAAHTIYKDTGGKMNGVEPFDLQGYQCLCLAAAHDRGACRKATIRRISSKTPSSSSFRTRSSASRPKGRLIALPRGATPIDFAYAVHTDVGDTCVGAKVNGRIMPLMTELKNGDEVEIIRSKAQVPPAAWESVVVTGKARSAIRRATKNAIRKQYSGLGIRILERTFERGGKTFSKESLKPVLHRLARKDIEDVLAAVGRGELSSTDVMKAVYPDFKDERITQAPKAREEGWFNLRNAAGMLFQIPGRTASRKAGTKSGTTQGSAGRRGPDQGRARRPACAFRAGRRGAGRSHRWYHAAGFRHHDLSDPVAVADGLRRPARALDRRALGHRRGHQGAVSGADFGNGDQCARVAC